MGDNSYIKWNTFSVNSDVSLQTLHDYIDRNISLKTRLAAGYDTGSYDISSVDTTYVVWKLKDNWVVNYPEDTDSAASYDVSNGSWDQITSSDIISPDQGYWIKYKICQNTGPSTPIGLKFEDNFLQIYLNNDNDSFNVQGSPPGGEQEYKYLNKLHISTILIQDSNLNLDGTDLSSDRYTITSSLQDTISSMGGIKTGGLLIQQTETSFPRDLIELNKWVKILKITSGTPTLNQGYNGSPYDTTWTSLNLWNSESGSGWNENYQNSDIQFM